MQKKHKVVCGLYGLGGPNAGENPSLGAFVTHRGGQIFKANQKNKIIRYLSAAAEEGRELVILGYSRGGNTAVNIANILGERGVNVCHLIVFDAHSLFDNTTFELHYNNVGEAYNFYQRNPRTSGRFGWWGSNPYWGSPLDSLFITVKQINFTGASCNNGATVSHLNIIRHSMVSFRHLFV